MTDFARDCETARRVRFWSIFEQSDRNHPRSSLVCRFGGRQRQPPRVVPTNEWSGHGPESTQHAHWRAGALRPWQRQVGGSCVVWRAGVLSSDAVGVCAAPTQKLTLAHALPA